MFDKHPMGRDLTLLPRTLALVLALGLGAATGGCADIHPAPDDSDLGMEEGRCTSAMKRPSPSTSSRAKKGLVRAIVSTWPGRDR